MVFDTLKKRTMSKVIGEEQDGSPLPDETFKAVSQTKVRRRPVFLAAGIALCAVFIIGMVALVNNMRDTTNILVVSHDIKQGQQITSQDLTTVQVNSDSGLDAIAVEQKSDVVGQTAAVPLRTGTVLNPNSVTTAVVPAKGLTMVGITASYAKLPATELMPGDFVRLVDTPRDQDDAPVQGPISTKAQVVSTKVIPDTGQVTVDVIVPEAEANWVGARAATGRVAIVLDSRER